LAADTDLSGQLALGQPKAGPGLLQVILKTAGVAWHDIKSTLTLIVYQVYFTISQSKFYAYRNQQTPVVWAGQDISIHVLAVQRRMRRRGWRDAARFRSVFVD
jgi:hypothetical protein